MILTLEFLGPYGAADVTRKDMPEWPPHPDRVFQSLVDAAELQDPAQVDALRWLESQPAPGLAVPAAVELNTADTFVPVNHPDSGLDVEDRNKQPRSFPMVWPRGDLSLVWPEPSAGVFSALKHISSRVTHVGRAESQVLAFLASGTMQPTHVPDAAGSTSLRVPYAGRFDELEAAFQARRYAAPAVPLAYGRRDEIAQRGPWSEIVSLKLRHPLSIGSVAEAADALRRAVMSIVGDTAAAPIHGHTTDRSEPHVAWLGLPNLSPFARGELLGLGVAVPARLRPIDRARLIQAVMALKHITMRGRQVAVEPPTAAMSLSSKSWCKAASVWRSVTPVVLDRYPKGRKLTAEMIVAQGLVDAGFPRPESIVMTDTGALGADLPSRAFRLRRPGRLYSHVEVAFASPVHGPVAIGAERHFGLGLCLPAGCANP